MVNRIVCSSMETPSKKPFVRRNAISLRHKMEILANIDRNPNRSQTVMCRELGIHHVTLKSILENRKQIIELFAAEETRRDMKKIRGTGHRHLDERLLKWFLERDGVSQEEMMVASRQFAQSLGMRHQFIEDNLDAWLRRFMERHGLSFDKRDTPPSNEDVCQAIMVLRRQTVLRGSAEAFEHLTKLEHALNVFSDDGHDDIMLAVC